MFRCYFSRESIKNRSIIIATLWILKLRARIYLIPVYHCWLFLPCVDVKEVLNYYTCTRRIFFFLCWHIFFLLPHRALASSDMYKTNFPTELFRLKKFYFFFIFIFFYLETTNKCSSSQKVISNVIRKKYVDVASIIQQHQDYVLFYILYGIPCGIF